jgi:hypothetical protein
MADRRNAMFPDWDLLSYDQQLLLSEAALRAAAEVVATQAELLAGEIETGALSDLGGAEALRLLAALVRVSGQPPDAWLAETTPVGCA